jgi:hypothetical protein
VNRVRRFSCLFLTLVALTACGPRIGGELIAGRTVMVTNQGEDPIRIERIIANDQTGRAECEDRPAVALAPGRSYTTTFFHCEEVREIDVETDAGWREVDFD